MDINSKQKFIVTVRRRAMQDEMYIESSVRKAGFLAGFVTEKLQTKSREMRLAVVQAITGLPIRSFKRLTSTYIDIIIEEITNEPTIVSAIESDCTRLLESGAGAEQAWDLYPWDKPTFDVSLLRSSD